MEKRWLNGISGGNIPLRGCSTSSGERSTPDIYLLCWKTKAILLRQCGGGSEPLQFDRNGISDCFKNYSVVDLELSQQNSYYSAKPLLLLDSI